MIDIILIFEHAILREVLRDSLMLENDLCVVAETAYNDIGVQLASRLQPDLVLIEAGFSGKGPEATMDAIFAESPSSRIVVLNTDDCAASLRERDLAGTAAYVHRRATKTELLGAIRSTVEASPRGTHADRWTACLAGDSVQVPRLTPRELEVVALVATARSNREIAIELEISESTVKRHLHNVSRKVGAVSRLGIVNRVRKIASVD